MGKRELGFFKLLKSVLEIKFKEEYTSCLLEITKWRQKEIIMFQELMEQKVNDRISEKWFYTHIKNENNTKLPRIDTLNLLCRFVNYVDWDDFIAKNKNSAGFEINRKIFKPFSKKLKKGVWIGLGFFLLVLVVVFFTNTGLLAQEKYSFCFVNSDSGEPLGNIDIEVYILHENGSSELIKCNDLSCFEYETG